ncbi:MAG: hypothetical protein Q7V19_04680 [Bacteroidales bacterium]|jgi:hypothetical protein|nr:hypothetical protein [Bacteroidales bacterium]MDP2237494.1 hypothetical protein [Bacteroidales bacterium]
MYNKPITPYSEESYPPLPTGSTRFWRSFVPWQAIRFVVLNLKIIRIVVGGHS